MQNEEAVFADDQMHFETERTIGQISELLKLVSVLHNAVQNGELGQAQVMTALHANSNHRKLVTGPLVPIGNDHLNSMMEELSAKLSDIENKIPDHLENEVANEVKLSSDQVFCFGTVNRLISQKPILRGYAEFVRSDPVGAVQSEKLVLFLMSIPGLKEKLLREKHDHFGYHYHYLGKDNRRSDTILTFGDPQNGKKGETLFFEKHAQKNKFPAQIDRWGNKKRISTYDTCWPDLRDWGLTVFKKPGLGAAPLWPWPN